MKAGARGEEGGRIWEIEAENLSILGDQVVNLLVSKT